MGNRVQNMKAWWKLRVPSRKIPKLNSIESITKDNML